MHALSDGLAEHETLADGTIGRCRPWHLIGVIAVSGSSHLVEVFLSRGFDSPRIDCVWSSL